MRGEVSQGKKASLPAPYTPKWYISRSALEVILGCPTSETEGDGFTRKLMKLKPEGPSLASPGRGLDRCSPIMFL